MDTLTHALSGALLARATCRKETCSPELSPARRTWIVFWASAFPDSDAVVGFLGPEAYLSMHRGVTHSFLMLPIWALVLAASFAWIYRNKGLALKRDWRILALLCAMGLGIHISFDLLNSYGTQILAPFSHWAPGLDLTFVIDLWFTGTLIVALIWSIFAASPLPARLGFLVLLGYLGGQLWFNQQAIAIGKEYAAAPQLRGFEVRALPQPASPLRWKIVVSDGDEHHWAYVDFGKDDEAAGEKDDAEGFFAELARGYQTPDSLVWKQLPRIDPTHRQAETAWNADEFRAFREFAVYPAWMGQSNEAAYGNCEWFSDLRFGLAGARSSFTYGLCHQRGQTEFVKLPRRAVSPWRDS